MFNQLDTNEDGKIDFEEFTELIKSAIEAANGEESKNEQESNPVSAQKSRKKKSAKNDEEEESNPASPRRARRKKKGGKGDERTTSRTRKS